MVLYFFKHGVTWDAVALMFDRKTSSFEKSLCTMMNEIRKPLVDIFIINVEDENSYSNLLGKGVKFKIFECARFASDVRFQMANIPGGIHFSDRKRYHSGKHHLYGFKSLATVLPTGECVFSSLHDAGSEADIKIFRKNKEWHHKALKKYEGEEDDDGELSDAYPNHWAVLMDKGFVGIEREVRAIIPKKNLLVVHYYLPRREEMIEWHRTGL